MNVFNKTNTANTGALEILTSHMLVGRANVKNTKLSRQLSTIPVDSAQPIHAHEPEQCYYIIRGKGLMIIEKEQEIVNPGDAIHIASSKRHGIKNIGNGELDYLTANAPAFNVDDEDKLWPHKGSSKKQGA